MTASASGPHSVSTNGAMFRPVPCSAFSAPSYCVTTRSTTSSMKRAYRSTTVCVVERLRDHEVEVPVPRVAEDDRLLVAVRAGRARLRSTAASARRSIGNATSSMMTVVPLFLTAPTDGNIPFRIFQRSACSDASCVKRAGSTRAEARHRLGGRASSAGRSLSSAAWNSARRPAAPWRKGPERPRDARLRPRPTAARRGPSPRAPSRPASLSGRIAAQAAWRSGKSRRPVYFTGRSGHRVEDRLGDERERPLRTDEEVREDRRPAASKSRKALSE